jgi:hypothetical protein
MKSRKKWYEEVLIKLFYPIALIKLIWLKLDKRSYYISGTGIHAVTKRRMWFKTSMSTHGVLLPLTTIEKRMQTELNLETCVVIFFNRIPNNMVKYLNRPMDITVHQTEIHEEYQTE